MRRGTQVLASFDDVYTIPWPQRLLDFFAMVQVRYLEERLP